MNNPKDDGTPSPAKSDEDDGYVAKKHCARCGEREEFVGGLIDIAADSDDPAEFCAGCLRKVLRQALRQKPFRLAALAGDVVGPELVARRGLLAGGQLRDYALLALEFDAPAPRLYCADARCGAFIPAGAVTRRVGKCLKCRRNTCKACRRPSHWTPCSPARLAAQAAEAAAIAAIARQHGWRFCPHCDCLIEMEATGCAPLVRCLLCCHDLCYICGGDAEDEEDHEECGIFRPYDPASQV